MVRFVVAYGVSVIAGALATYFWSKWLHARVAKYRTDGSLAGNRVDWIPAVVGILERILYTLVVGYEVSGAAGFIGAWVTIKAIGGWAHWSEDKSTYGRCLFSAGLLGSALSALFGITGGLLFLKWCSG